MEGLNQLLSGMLLIEALFIAILAYYSFMNRRVPGAMPFMLICMAAFFYTFGYAMELISTTVSQINWWGKFQYIGLPFIPSFWVLLAISYTGNQWFKKHSLKPLFFGVPILTAFFRWTSEYHSLMYINMRLVDNGLFNVIHFDKGAWYYFHFVYFMICALVAIAIYLNARKAAIGYMKQQLVIMIVASAMPMLSIGANLSSLVPLQLDSGPLFVFVNFFMFTYGIYRYNMMHLIPLSRDKVFDWIADGALVVDSSLKLIDFNQAASEWMPELNRQAIGTDIRSVLSSYDEFLTPLVYWHKVHLATELEDPTQDFGDDVFEFTLSEDPQHTIRYVKVRMTDIVDNKRKIGATLLMSDVTKQKEIMIQLEKLAHFDGLTQVFNRRHFIEVVERDMRRLERQSAMGVMVLFDVDNFKSINDQYGHQTGDYVLKEIVLMTKNHLRATDLVGRYGGEEFILFLPDTAMNEAIVAAERIRSAFEETTLKWQGHRINMTSSFGLTSCQKSSNDSGKILYKTFDEMVKDADLALYMAKNEGKNRVCKHL